MNVQEIINQFAKENYIEVESGGGFYTPEEWKERGEEFGNDSEGVIVHDGGDFAPFINMDYGTYALGDKFLEYLERYGYYHEPATCWYTSIYKI